MATKGKVAAEESRRVLVETRSGTFRLTIPVDYKMTFGPLVPASGRGFGDQGGTALRIYRSKDEQIACFRDVVSFRDLSIPIERLIVSEKGESSWATDESGHVSTKSIKRTKKWEQA